MRRFLALSVLLPAAVDARAGVVPPSAPITNVRYEITADSANLASRHLSVEMTFSVSSSRPVVLALPAWSPGHYTLLWFARRVSQFVANEDGKSLDWRKLDFQTWEIRPKAAGTVKVSFRYLADAVDRAVAWTAPNFAFFNGTNLFLYPVGRGFDWPATVTVRTEAGWRVTTGMNAMPGARNVFSAANYHDLVDMPFYAGRFDVDSARVANHWVRFALYPAGAMTPARRDRTLGWLTKLLPADADVFRDIPFENYTVFVRSDTLVNGGGLEHQSSQVDEVHTSALDADLSGLYAHEMFHAWNVKRLRPADLVPYRYDDAQPSSWLWVSEGITEYYATLSLLRSGIIDSTVAYDGVAGSIVNSSSPAAAQVSLSDASLSTWTGPLDGTDGLYYPKGALAGFLLDVLIRDASGNRHSLDDVMRELYQATYKRGRGFTSDDWWSAVARNAGTRAPFVQFARRHIDGRDPIPVDSILALAALRVEQRVISEPRLGITTRDDSTGVSIASIAKGGSADAAGARVGDRVLSVGDVRTTKTESFADFRSRYASTTLANLPLVVRRGTDTLTLSAPVRLTARQETKLVPTANPSAKAVAIRTALFQSRSP
jgi:predicted metalloprotease with PDZ domain